MLLGFIIEDAGGRRSSDRPISCCRRVTAETLLFNPPAGMRPSIAPTENDPWRGRRLVGEVHDENCWALGGAAGHAGLFGTAAAVGDFARAMLGALWTDETRCWRRRRPRARSSRAPAMPGRERLGGTRCCRHLRAGRRCPVGIFGHTGFTGTTLWIDPERGIYVVFLTNRVNPSRENTAHSPDTAGAARRDVDALGCRRVA